LTPNIKLDSFNLGLRMQLPKQSQAADHPNT